MTVKLPRNPRLSLPFTVIAEGSLIYLIAGEDVRYSVEVGEPTSELAELLRGCTGATSLTDLLSRLPETHRAGAEDLLRRLQGERLLIEGPVEKAHVVDDYQIVAHGSGSLAERFSPPSSGGRSLTLLCQDSLDHHTALEFNRACLRANTDPWLWVTTGPAQRGYVSPVFLPDAGPCLACLIRHFQRLSPVPQLYETLIRHGSEGGTIPPVPFPQEGITILEQLVRWKVGQLREGSPSSAVFQLHVLELNVMEVKAHRVLLDPTCSECRDARMV